MQTMTVAISPAGINYFTQNLVMPKLSSDLQSLTPPDNSIVVNDISTFCQYGPCPYYDVTVTLNQGNFTNFYSNYNNIVQNQNGTFNISVLSNFSVNYNWNEVSEYCFWNGIWKYVCNSNQTNNWPYTPSGSMNINIPAQLIFNQTNNDYEFVIPSGQSPTGSSSIPNIAIPSNSILNGQTSDGCFSTHVDSATQTTLNDINFVGAIGNLFGALSGLIAEIPASGNLISTSTVNITYNFGVASNTTAGENNITYPNNTGIVIGIEGPVTYNGQTYPGEVPQALTVPSVPQANSQGNQPHVNVYVSNYEIDALHWAFYEAGLLNATIIPANLSNPDNLQVKTYFTGDTIFAPYEIYFMNVAINPIATPVMSFQTVYQFNETVLNNLVNDGLPSNIINYLNASLVEADAIYPDQNSLETALDLYLPPNSTSYYPAIENASITNGLVVNYNLQYNITIQTPYSPYPDMLFNCSRMDILQNLQLGNVSTTQTMQYGLTNYNYSLAFVSSTIPGVNASVVNDFSSGVAGAVETVYASVVQDMGKTGVAIPIMQGFNFIFEDAVLTIEEGYISILANVSLDPSFSLSDYMMRNSEAAYSGDNTVDDKNAELLGEKTHYEHDEL